MPSHNARTATFVLFVVVFVNLVGFGIVIPLLPFYAEHYGASPDQVAMLMAVYSGAQFLAAPLWGRASDRWGRKPVLVVSLAGTLASYLWLAYADDLTDLFLARSLAGMMAGSIAAAFAYVADVTEESARARGIGMIGAAFGLGFIAGPAIGGLLAGSGDVVDFRLPALAAVGFSGVALVLAATLLAESLTAQRRAAAADAPPLSLVNAARMPGVPAILLLSFLAVFAFAGLEAVFALWSERSYGWGVRENGYAFAFLGLVSALIQGGLIGRLTRRFGEAALTQQGFVALALGLAIIPFATELPILLIALVIATYGFSVSTPALTALLTMRAPAGATGVVVGIGRSATTLARAAGPAFAGYVFALAGKDWPFFAAAAILAVVVAASGRMLGGGASGRD